MECKFYDVSDDANEEMRLERLKDLYFMLALTWVSICSNSWGCCSNDWGCCSNRWCFFHIPTPYIYTFKCNLVIVNDSLLNINKYP